MAPGCGHRNGIEDASPVLWLAGMAAREFTAGRRWRLRQGVGEVEPAFEVLSAELVPAGDDRDGLTDVQGLVDGTGGEVLLRDGVAMRLAERTGRLPNAAVKLSTVPPTQRIARNRYLHDRPSLACPKRAASAPAIAQRLPSAHQQTCPSSA